MPNTDRKLRVFVAHSSADQSKADRLVMDLKDNHWIEPWLGEEKFFPGQDTELEIKKAIEAADVVIVCLSNNSTSKEGYVQKELKFALDIALERPKGTIEIIPFILDNCQIPQSFKAFQCINDYMYDGYDRLEIELRKRAASLSIISGYFSAFPGDPTTDAPLPRSKFSKTVLVKSTGKFLEIQSYIDDRPADRPIGLNLDKEHLKLIIERIEEKVRKGDSADLDSVGDGLELLAIAADDVFQFLVASFANHPLDEMEVTIAHIAQKIKEERKHKKESSS